MSLEAEPPLSAAPPAGGCWPDRQQELLLKAALLESKTAQAVWADWRKRARFDALDPASHRLLPLVYHNLHEIGADDPKVVELEGIYRYFWLRNQVLFNHAADVVRMLRGAGIQTLLLKGAALVLRHLHDYGLRPMDDFDLLVPCSQAETALQLLRENGWRLVRPEQLKRQGVGGRHSANFINADNINFDLHWHVLRECLGPRDDDEFWSAAEAVELQELRVLVLNPADQLLHLCVHGVRWHMVPPLRWVADSVLLLRAAADLDWDRLARQTEQRRLILPVRDALHYLVRVLGAPVPAAVLARLDALPVTPGEETAYLDRLRPHHLTGPLATVRSHYEAYLRSTTAPGCVGFFRYLQRAWKVRRWYQLPFVALGKATRKVWSRTLWEVANRSSFRSVRLNADKRDGS